MGRMAPEITRDGDLCRPCEIRSRQNPGPLHGQYNYGMLTRLVARTAATLWSTLPQAREALCLNNKYEFTKLPYLCKENTMIPMVLMREIKHEF